jgi:hypothetical protein
MDKEKLIRDFVEGFDDQTELHAVYKEKMKEILTSFFCYLLIELRDKDIEVPSIMKLIHHFVEDHFHLEKST